MKFSEIAGHKKEKEILTSLVSQDKIPHAILLHGPAGLGKMSLARAFVQYIACRNPHGHDSCGTCSSCLQTAKLNNPDIHYIFPVIKKGTSSVVLSQDFATEWQDMLENYPFMPYEQWLDIISAGSAQPQIYVSESDNIIRISSLSTYGSKYKIFVVWLPEKMNAETANKLLKVIEEPFEDTLFVLVSNDAGAILPTIKSRLRSIEVKPLGEDEVIEWIISKGLDSNQARNFAAIAKGNMNKVAELMSRNGEINEFTSLFMDVMRACYITNIEQVRDISEQIASFGREKELRLLAYFARMTRESFISNLKNPGLTAMTDAEEAFTAKFGPFIHSGNVEEIMAAIDQAHLDISRNANQKIVWFDLLLLFSSLLKRPKPKNINN